MFVVIYVIFVLCGVLGGFDCLLQNWRDFTTDAKLFPADEFQSFVSKLHAQGQHFVPIVDPGIYAIPNDPSNPDSVPYYAGDIGLEQGVFVRDLGGSTPYVGSVWPGPTYFPDWFAANATAYWTEQLTQFHNLVPYDGIWIDMNEVRYAIVCGSCSGSGIGSG